MAMFDICHLFNDSPHPKKVSHLKHTSDYDHTDQVRLGQVKQGPGWEKHCYYENKSFSLSSTFRLGETT